MRATARDFAEEPQSVALQAFRTSGFVKSRGSLEKLEGIDPFGLDPRNLAVNFASSFELHYPERTEKCSA